MATVAPLSEWSDTRQALIGQEYETGYRKNIVIIKTLKCIKEA